MLLSDSHIVTISASLQEGVETELHFKKLEQLNCDYCQGHLFSKPITSKGLIKLFKEWGTSHNENEEIPAEAMATWNGQYNS